MAGKLQTPSQHQLMDGPHRVAVENDVKNPIIRSEVVSAVVIKKTHLPEHGKTLIIKQDYEEVNTDATDRSFPLNQGRTHIPSLRIYHSSFAYTQGHSFPKVGRQLTASHQSVFSLQYADDRRKDA